MSRRSRSPVHPRRAIVLAAGYGTRLLPLTRVLPKPLLPLWHVPMLEHVLRLLRRWGVQHVLVNGHHGADQVWDYLRRRPRDGLAVSFSYEPEILGTGGVLKRAAWFLDDAPFWMINADVAADLDPDPFLRIPLGGKTVAALWLHPDRGPRTVEVKRGKIVSFRSRTPRGKGNFTFCGLHYLSPVVLQFIEKEGFSSIITAYERAQQYGFNVSGVVPDRCYWADIGNPEQYLAAHREIMGCHRMKEKGGGLFSNNGKARELRSRGVAIRGFAAVSTSARVAPGASLQDVVLLDDVWIGGAGQVEAAVVAPGTRIRGRVERIGTSAHIGLEPEECRAIEELGWQPARTEASFSVPRGSSRQFVRLRSGSRRAMLVRYGVDRDENLLYAGHARFLDRVGVRVPRVLADRPAQRFTLFEDLGDRSLQRELVRIGKSKADRLYRRVLREVAILHVHGTREATASGLALMPPFNEALYRWERQWFAEQFMRGVMDERSDSVALVQKELRGISRLLLKQPRVLIHRDLQSSNIFFVNKRPAFIDFQGMRMGTAAYDLASLLCDPYVRLPFSLVEELVSDYGEQEGAHSVPRGIFWAAAVQRLIQALGAFGRLSSIPGNEDFATHIPPALQILKHAIHQTDLSLDALKACAERGLG